MPVDLRDAVTCMLHDCAQGLRWRRQDFDSAAPIVPHFCWRIADPDKFRRLKHSGRTIGELEIEPTADGENDIRVAHHGSAHRTDHGWMAVRHEAATLAGVEIDGPQPIEQRDKLRTSTTGAATGN